MQQHKNFYIITGGPGSGKSVLVDYLEQQGFSRSIEAGRSIIQYQMMIGGTGLPWKDKHLFAELMLSWDIRSYQVAQKQKMTYPVIFDRGIPDIIGYLLLEKLEVPSHIYRAGKIFRYNTRVFIAPHWAEIYHQDSERKQDEETALRTYNAMVSIYRELSYELIELPKVSVKDRAEFVRRVISE